MKSTALISIFPLLSYFDSQTQQLNNSSLEVMNTKNGFL